ncbi:hypothetical protein OG874_21575 [Nocardia sp. NBC_00565]|uniref:hypothetical protein n=1 Tax=Nocardia sp. NBC_00565 TaxID=2975993 RepID=UPI002E81FCE7|nr:hypothetical protein [Nocardia sp. NBC_00565]WUC07516.1 hypothetical protein OG874_21575 [Nocardia sp. NBC_00565]
MPVNVISALLITVVVLVGIIVAGVTAMLSKISGAPVARAVRDGGVAFAGTVTLALLLMTSLHDL